MNQRTLFDAPTKPSTAERFEQFLKTHDWFIPEIIRMARERKAAGDKRWSTKAAFELLRHRFRRNEEYGLNNNFSAPCARRVMEAAPDLQGFFETR